MATYVILSKLCARAVEDPAELRQLAETVSQKIKAECPNVRWKDSYALMGGFDVVDDVALGQMLKQHGARGGVMNGHGYVGVRWYESVRDMASGAEKGALASFAAFSMVRLVVICFALLMFELAPFVGVFVVGRPALQAVAAGGIACAVVAQLIPSAWFGRPCLFPSRPSCSWRSCCAEVG